jgi:hypothetical protein
MKINLFGFGRYWKGIESEQVELLLLQFPLYNCNISNAPLFAAVCISAAPLAETKFKA